MEKVINVFVKQRPSKEGKTFPVYLTKGKDDNCYKVVFTQDCVNRHLIPANKCAFVLITEHNKCSISTKTATYNDREITTRTLYVNSITRIEEYVDEGIGDDIF